MNTTVYYLRSQHQSDFELDWLLMLAPVQNEILSRIGLLARACISCKSTRKIPYPHRGDALCFDKILRAILYVNRSHFYRLVRSNFEKIVPDSIVLSCIGFLVADGLRTNGNFLKSAEDIAPFFFSFSTDTPLQL